MYVYVCVCMCVYTGNEEVCGTNGRSNGQEKTTWSCAWQAGFDRAHTNKTTTRKEIALSKVRQIADTYSGAKVTGLFLLALL